MYRRTALKITLLGLFGFVLLSTLHVATAEQSGDFGYFDNGSGITITDYTGPGGDVVIPATIDRLPVTGIDNYAFQFNTNLTTVTIPKGVSSIRYLAFYDCTKLLAINLDAANMFYSSLEG